MRTTDLTDFSGGIREVSAPSDFSATQWTALKGYVITDATQLRSQWPIQQVSTAYGFRSVQSITGKNNKKYLVGIKDEQLFYLTLPDDTTAYSNASMKALTWSALKNQSNQNIIFLTADKMKFLCEVPVYTTDDGIRTGLLYDSVETVANPTAGTVNGQSPVVVYEKADGSGLVGKTFVNGSGEAKVFPGYVPSAPSNVTFAYDGTNTTVKWVYGNAGSSAITSWKIYDGNGVYISTVSAPATSAVISGAASTTGYIVRGINSYGETPLDAEGGVLVPAPKYIPHANVGVTWAGQVVLGDVRWFKNSIDAKLNVTMDVNNTTRQANMIWFSNIEAPDSFDPIATFTVGSADCTITGMKVIPQGLLVLTTSPTEGDGLFLLRGRSIGVVTSQTLDLNFYVELVRGTLGSIERPNGIGDALTLWPTLGTAAFLSSNSQVWHTNTSDVLELAEFGPKITAGANEYDCIATCGRYLFMIRNKKLYVMREFQSQGAWTELVYEGYYPRGLMEFDNSVYFVSNFNDNSGFGSGYVYRILTNPTHTDANSERGMVNGTKVDLTVITRTLGEPNRFEKSMWHRVGVRIQGIRDAVLKSITSTAGAYFAYNYAPFTTTYPPEAITGRFEKVAQAHGPSIEMYATIVAQGDLSFEAVTVYDHGKMPRRK